MNRHFTEENLWMANKHMKISLTSLAIRIIQVKTIRYQYTPTRKAKIRKSSYNTKCWQGYKRTWITLLHCEWDIKW